MGEGNIADKDFKMAFGVLCLIGIIALACGIFG